MHSSLGELAEDESTPQQLLERINDHVQTVYGIWLADSALSGVRFARTNTFVMYAIEAFMQV